MLSHTRISRVNPFCVLLTCRQVSLAKLYVHRSFVSVFSRDRQHLLFRLLLMPQDKSPQIPRLGTMLADKLPVLQRRSPGTAWWVLHSGSLQAKTQLCPSLRSSPAALGSRGCRLTSAPCVCRPHAPHPSLAVPGGHSQLRAAAHIPCHVAPPASKLATHIKSFSQLNS